jgi:hypothetical protein
MADVDYVYDWDWPRAEREFRLAVEHGAQATTRSYYRWALATRGRFSEAHSQLRIAQDLDPLNVGPRFNEAIAFLLERRFPDSITLLHADDPLTEHVMIGVISIYRRDRREAAMQFNSLPAGSPSPIKLIGQAWVAACLGAESEARGDLAKAAAEKSFVSPYQLAMGYAAIGDADRSLEYLNRSAEAREGQIFYIKLDPAFDGIRSDPGFTELEKRIGLTP